jgi:hypothetical protein
MNVSAEIAEVIRQLPTAQELELEALRRRVKRQRAELRRLNRQHAWFISGFNTGSAAARSNKYRGHMIDAFGIDAVMKAERGRLTYRPAHMRSLMGWIRGLFGGRTG